MHVFIQDTNPVPSSETEMFRVLQQGPVHVGIIIKNAGDNNLSYRFQESTNAVTWTDITGATGTLIPSGTGQVAFHHLTSALAQMRCMASGDTVLDFSISRYFTRVDNGAIPILAL